MKIVYGLVSFLFFMNVAYSADESSLITGETIVKRSLDNGKSFTDFVQNVVMRLHSKDGDVAERSMRFKALVNEDKDKYSLITFTAPRREKGIALLTVAITDKKNEASNQQFLYLPSTRRVKRVLGASRGASFRGSEFTFEDLADQSIEDYRFTLVREETCREIQCYVVDRYPKKDGSNYTRTRLWIDHSHYRLMRADFYDLDDEFLKTLQAKDFKKEGGAFWYPKTLTMTNYQTGSSTEMIVESLALNGGLEVKDFSERALRRGR